MLNLLKDETFVRPETQNVHELLLETKAQLEREKKGLKQFQRGLDQPPR